MKKVSSKIRARNPMGLDSSFECHESKAILRKIQNCEMINAPNKVSISNLLEGLSSSFFFKSKQDCLGCCLMKL